MMIWLEMFHIPDWEIRCMIDEKMKDWWASQMSDPLVPSEQTPPSGQGSDFCLSVVCRGCERIFTALWNKDTQRENKLNQTYYFNESKMKGISK